MRVCTKKRRRFSGSSQNGGGTITRDVTLEDQQNYSRGQYAAYLSPWSTIYNPALVHGVDYIDQIELSSQAFPVQSLMYTTWPTGALPAGAGVWGYFSSAIFGNYDGHITEVPVDPIKIGEITSFTQSHNMSFTGSDHFDYLNEFFTTAAPNDNATHLHEVGIFWRIPTELVSWHLSGANIGSGVYTDSQGRLWTARLHAHYIHIAPSDLIDRPVDPDWNWKHFIDWLVTNSALGTEEWINGVAFGNEPTVGGGSTVTLINDFRVKTFAGPANDRVQIRIKEDDGIYYDLSLPRLKLTGRSYSTERQYLLLRDT